jgi:hypothetical protein
MDKKSQNMAIKYGLKIEKYGNKIRIRWEKSKIPQKIFNLD